MGKYFGKLTGFINTVVDKIKEIITIKEEKKK
jgi:hypothetical protein